MASNFRYPLRAPVAGGSGQGRDAPTEAIDYVMFHRQVIKYDDQSSNYYGLNMPDNKVQLKPDKDRVYIAMPSSLSTNYAPAYRQTDLGVAGMALAEGQVGAADGDLAKIATTIQEAAGKALPEFTQGAFAQAASGASQFLGLAGSFNANDIVQLTKGKVFNPYTEQMFSNMTFRTHSFNFKMFARDAKEADEIAKIIAYLKQGALPKYGAENKARFFEVPEKFNIKFVRMQPNGLVSDDTDNIHFKIHTSVCTGINVNYTPDGQYASFKQLVKTGQFAGVHVPAVQLGLQFTETRFVTAEDVDKGF